MFELHTARLKLVPLTTAQLRLYFDDHQHLAAEMGATVVVQDTPIIRRAIDMKLAKMALAPPSRHRWYTYWLIVVVEQSCGVGLAGFKGYPNEHGETEIGYSIDRDWQNKGYMTEAVCALVDWAFQHDVCLTVTATGVLKSNLASQRVLTKTGFEICGQTDEALQWRINKNSYPAG